MYNFTPDKAITLCADIKLAIPNFPSLITQFLNIYIFAPGCIHVVTVVWKPITLFTMWLSYTHHAAISTSWGCHLGFSS